MSAASSLQALSLVEAHAQMCSGALGVADYAGTLLAHTLGSEPRLHAFAHIDAAQIRNQVRALELVHATARGPLYGIGVGIKDIIGTADMPTLCGASVPCAQNLALDATCVARLRAAGGYVFGKTVTTEFAFLTPGLTTNPWNPAHTPGGSSSGSAAAVANGDIPAAIGTQTNGSVIRPAAYCGVVGFKPTRGALPFAGVHLFSATLDTLGTFTRTVADAARLASVLADAGRIAPAIASPQRAPRLALLESFPWTIIDAEVAGKLDAVASRLRMAGAEVIPVSLPDALTEARDVHRTIMLHEASRNLDVLQRRARGQLSAALNAALDEGRAIDGDAYLRAKASRQAMLACAQDWMARFDAVVSAPAPSVAPASLATTGDPACCTLWSLLGVPAIALPVGWSAKGLPLGMQLASTTDSDDALLALAAWIESKLRFRVAR
jgi:amidase